MAKSSGGNTVQRVEALARSVVESMGLRLWDVVFEKEGPDWYLRILIDKTDGSVMDTDTCAAVSHALDPVLDEADPIPDSYVFEVSSAGAERELKRPGDFSRFMGSPVLVKTYQNRDGRKEFAGKLAGYEDGAVLLDMGGAEPVRFEKNEVALVRLRVEF